jgi:RNA polymerase sigma-70 factor (ECF subfamily)
VNDINVSKRVNTSPDRTSRTVSKHRTDEPQPEFSQHLMNQDELAYEKLLNQYSNRVYRLAMTLVKNNQDAEDVIQEVFITVCSGIDDLKEDKALSSWIYRITVNASLMKIQANGCSEIISFEEDLPRFDPNGNHIKPVIDWSESPEEKVSSKELMDFIRKDLDNLPDTYKVVFILRDLEGLSNKAVADVLDMSLTAVKSTLHRARLFMRERLSKYFREITL